jgi:hypothetical protein
MSNSTTQDVTVLVKIPSELGLSRREVTALEEKWQADLAKAVTASNSAARIHFHITIHIEVGND